MAGGREMKLMRSTVVAGVVEVVVVVVVVVVAFVVVVVKYGGVGYCSKAFFIFRRPSQRCLGGLCRSGEVSSAARVRRSRLAASRNGAEAGTLDRLCVRRWRGLELCHLSVALALVLLPRTTVKSIPH